MSLNDFDLTLASRVYGIANTAPFLVRKLQADPTIRAMGETCKVEDILAALRSAADVEPTTAVDAVRPYALLVALWFKPEVDHLKEAAKVPASAYRWFPEVAELLIQNFSPVHRQTVQVPGLLSAPSVSVTSSASTTTTPPIILAER